MPTTGWLRLTGADTLTRILGLACASLYATWAAHWQARHDEQLGEDVARALIGVPKTSPRRGIEQAVELPFIAAGHAGSAVVAVIRGRRSGREQLRPDRKAAGRSPAGRENSTLRWEPEMTTVHEPLRVSPMALPRQLPAGSPRSLPVLDAVVEALRASGEDVHVVYAASGDVFKVVPRQAAA